ncbi:winged helix-turn-helix domain-containing protein [Paenibacillus humicola]|uniref:winged helix-turn-helix domain-containing protein n=1 Tax=Paenibacillus humicola TaxID=3110540 RepID=UPI00237ACA45|nr:winged helix-turn-helix domain-containing protein [Paenibacillus humicola]
MKQEFSVADIARKLRLSDSTVHRRIQLAIDMGWIQPEKKGSRCKYTETDLSAVDMLEMYYKKYHTDEKLLEIISKTRREAANNQHEAIVKLTDTFNLVTNELMILISNVTHALEKAEERNKALARQMHNIQDKLDALSVRIIRAEDKLNMKYNQTS